MTQTEMDEAKLIQTTVDACLDRALAFMPGDNVEAIDAFCRQQVADALTAARLDERRRNNKPVPICPGSGKGSGWTVDPSVLREISHGCSWYCEMEAVEEVILELRNRGHLTINAPSDQSGD